MKKWYWSNTIQLAVVQFLIGFSEAFFTEYPPQVGWAIMAKSIIDMLLRKKTTGGIA